MDIVTLLNERRAGKSVLAFAGETGLEYPWLQSVLTGKRELGLEGVRRIAGAFPDDAAIQQALAAHCQISVNV